MPQNSLTMARLLFRNSDDRVVALVLTKSAAHLLAQTCGGLAWDRRVLRSTVRKRQLFWNATCMVFWTGGPSPKGEQGYDVRNDQALPSLQTAINKESAHRYRTVRLRQACLAGVASQAHSTPPALSFRLVQVTSSDKTLS